MENPSTRPACKGKRSDAAPLPRSGLIDGWTHYLPDGASDLLRRAREGGVVLDYIVAKTEADPADGSVLRNIVAVTVAAFAANRGLPFDYGYARGETANSDGTRGTGTYSGPASGVLLDGQGTETRH
jgi:hypothetical protein